MSSSNRYINLMKSEFIFTLRRLLDAGLIRQWYDNGSLHFVVGDCLIKIDITLEKNLFSD